MKTLDKIKQMMTAGDAALADEALKELLANEPDNLQAKMLYGTCRRFLGDEETFKRIHDELVPMMKGQKAGVPSEIDSQWMVYHRTFTELTQDSLVRKSNEVELLTLYGGIPYDEMDMDDENTRPCELYGAGSMDEIIRLKNELKKRGKERIKRKCFVILGVVLTVLLFYIAWYLGKTL